MNNSEIQFTTPLLVLFISACLLCLFAGWGIATWLMKAATKDLIEQRGILLDYLKNIGDKVKNFQKTPQIGYHKILTDIQGITKQFLKK